LGTESKLVKKLRQHEKIGLDTSIFIYQFEGSAYSKLTGDIFESIERGICRAFVSTLVLTEVLVRPFSEKDTKMVEVYNNLFKTWPNLSVVEVSPEIAVEAARMRAEHNIKTPDAIILATTTLSGGTLFITNEQKLKRLGEIEVLILGDYI
jgi:predicted nucleic acid-binding protein